MKSLLIFILLFSLVTLAQTPAAKSLAIASDEDIADMKKVMGSDTFDIPLFVGKAKYGAVIPELHFSPDNASLYFRTMFCKDTPCNNIVEQRFSLDLHSRTVTKIASDPDWYAKEIMERHRKPDSMAVTFHSQNNDDKYSSKVGNEYQVTSGAVPITAGVANRVFWPTFDDIFKGKFVMLEDGVTTITTLTVPFTSIYADGTYAFGNGAIRVVNSKTGKVVNLRAKRVSVCINKEQTLLAYSKLDVRFFHIHLAKLELK